MTMMESITKQQEEQKGNNDINLGISLNIVAVQDDNANSKKKRKRKLNKYDKRRRRKEAAAAAAGAGATKEDGGTADGEAKETEDRLGEKEKEHNDIRPQQEQQDKDEVDGKEDKNGNEEEAPTGQEEEDGEDTNETTKAVTKDDEDHAAYMAEYHARPLELDRRSGATITNINKATKRRKKSSHQEEETTTATATASNSDVFSKETEWKDMNLDSKIVNLLPHSKPTKIQEIVIRKILTTTKNNNNEHTNFWIQSETGSGKTLAYFLPILQHMWQNLTKQQTNHNQNKKIDRASLGTQCLIICPTQELVQQTQQACEQLATKLCAGQLVVGILRGQANKTKEKARIRKGLGVLVSTPGRLLDHLQTTACLQTAVRKLQWLVLDEVDRLFDMGLSPQLKQVVELLQQFAGSKNKWRSTLVSATVPPEVKETVQELLSTGKASEWAWIQQQQQQPQSQTIQNSNSVGDKQEANTGGGRSLPKQLVQYHILVSAKLRLTTLIAFLTDRVHLNERTVVFLSTCASVDYLHELFQKMDCILKGVDDTRGGLFGSSCSVDRLHGNVPHQERQSILQSFTKPRTAAASNNKKKKKTPQQARILLATDVAARGLNLHADWTVQYDPPCEIADYIHRAGRVARAGQMGQSLLFLLPSEKSLLGILQLKQNSEKAIPAVSLTSTLQQAAKLCPDVMRAGLQRNGMMSKSNTKEISVNTSSSSSSRGGGSRQGEAFCSELQYRLEECVLEQSKAAQKQVDKESRNNNKKKRKRDNAAAAATLLDMARAAFLSHMRAYPTKEKLVRHIFSARALHLGHIAKSFALREPPKTLVKNSKGSGAGGWGNNNKKKRNATASFGKQGDNHDSDEEFATTNGKTAAQKRAMLMANAAKLQMGGVDGF